MEMVRFSSKGKTKEVEFGIRGIFDLNACWCRSFNPEGHLSGRRQGEPACASVGAEERIFCGLGVWPEMKMFAVACWRRSFSSALRLLGCEFVPLIVERGGAVSESVNKFINNISDVAYSRKQHDKGFFVHCWNVVLANSVLQDVARMRRRQVRGLVEVTSRGVSRNTRLFIQDGQMSSVSAEGRLLS